MRCFIYFSVGWLLAEAGLSHRRASNFLVRDKKVTKEARLPTAIRQNSLRACSASLKQVAVKVMTMQLHSAVQLPAPRTCRRRRGHKGQYRIRDSFFVQLIAAAAISNWA